MNPLERQIKKGEAKEFVLLPSSSDTEQIAAHVVALINSGGGSIVLEPHDWRQPKLDSNVITSAHELGAHLRKVISPRPLLSVTSEQAFEDEVILIEVPGGRDLPFLLDGRVFLRRGFKTIPANAEDLQEIFQRQTPETIRWERRGSPTLELDDLNHDQIETTVHAAIAEGRFSFSDPQSTETILGELGMFSGGILTNACDVCFGKTPSTRNPQVRLRAYAFQSDKQGDDYLDQADLNGPVANVLASAVAFIQRNASTAAMFVSDSVERQNLA